MAFTKQPQRMAANHFASRTLAEAANPLAPGSDIITVLENGEYVVYAREDGGSDLIGDDASEWRRVSVTGADILQAAIDTLNAAEFTIYEEIAFVPVLTFATPGDSVVTYPANSQYGKLWRTGDRVEFILSILGASVAVGSASGAIRIAGFPGNLPVSPAGLGTGFIRQTAGIDLQFYAADVPETALDVSFAMAAGATYGTLLIMSASGAGTVTANAGRIASPGPVTVNIQIAGSYEVGDVSQILITATECQYEVGGATLIGNVATIPATVPWSGATSTADAAFRARNAGKVRRVDVLRGVRYAAAPVGALRWKPPVDYDYPAGTFRCQKWGDVSFQSYFAEGGSVGRPEWGLEAGAFDWAAYGVREREDCTHLTLYIPRGPRPPGGWPVLYWTHGGGWTVNSAISYQQRGFRLATKGVLVVCVNYPLSTFGHFYHPDIADEEDWEGPNFSYAFIKSGLRWVSRNIASFGGNPDKVNPGGTSAGGAATQGIMADAECAALFAGTVVSSGGGSQDRSDVEKESYTAEGYAVRYDRYARAVQAVAPVLRDYSDPTRSLAEALADADTIGNGLRLGLSPWHILALADAASRITRSSLMSGAAERAYVASQNFYPLEGNGLAARNDIEAAKAGLMTKPAMILAAESEISLVPNYGQMSDQQVANFLDILGVPSLHRWKQEGFVNPLWTGIDYRRLAYTHPIFHFPAWRIAKARHGIAPTWLMLWGFGGSPTADHSTDVHYWFGNVEWNVGVSEGGEAMVQLRHIYMAEAMMQALANFCMHGDPNTAYEHSEDFDYFEGGYTIDLEPYSDEMPYHWNIIGSDTHGGAQTASPTAEHRPYYGGAWAYYETTYG